MKDSKELKGGIIPLLASLIVGEAFNSLLDQKLSEKEQVERNRAEWEARQRAKEESKQREREAQAERIRLLNEENELKRIEMNAMSQIYTKQKELQQKSAVEDIKRAQQRSAVQREIEQSRSNLQTLKQQQEKQKELERSALESQQQLIQQQKTAEGMANLESMKQRAIADVRKRFAPKIVEPIRRLPQARSTALLTKTGRGYNNEILDFLQSYYGISLKEAKKIHKIHF